MSTVSGPTGSLTRKTGRALRWNYIGMITKMGLSFGTNVLLTRILGPRPFGEMAIAMIVFGFGTLLSNAGLNSALIQKESLDDDDISFCFTCQIGIGLIMSFLLFGTSSLWARFFHDEEIKVLLRVFSSLFILQAFGTTSIGLLNRAQDARTIQWITIVSYIAGYVGLGLPLALKGAGVWSLVAAWLLQAFLSSTLAYAQVRHSIRLRFHPDHLPMLRFAAKILGANICSWGIFNLDNIMVGRMNGPYALGFYSRAFALATSADGVTSNLLQVLLPAFSRVQGEKEKLRKVYVSVLGLVLLIFLPIFGTVAVSADIVVLGLYGPKWIPVIPLLRPIALAIVANAALTIAGPMLTARGRPGAEFKAQSLSVVVGGALYALAVQHSLVTLGWTVLGVYVFRCYLLNRSVNAEIGTRWSDFLPTIWPAVVLAGLTCLGTKGVMLILPRMPAPLRLASVIAGALVFEAAILFAFARYLFRPILSRSPQLLLLVPTRLHRLVEQPQS